MPLNMMHVQEIGCIGCMRKPIVLPPIGSNYVRGVTTGKLRFSSARQKPPLPHDRKHSPSLDEICVGLGKEHPIHSSISALGAGSQSTNRKMTYLEA